MPYPPLPDDERLNVRSFRIEDALWGAVEDEAALADETAGDVIREAIVRELARRRRRRMAQKS